MNEVVIMPPLSFLRQTFSEEVVEHIGGIAKGAFKIPVGSGLEFTLAVCSDFHSHCFKELPKRLGGRCFVSLSVSGEMEAKRR